MIPFNYGNLDLGFPCGMDKPRGLFTVMLAARHEGAEWEWVDNRESFIPQGPPGSYYGTGAVPLHNEPMIVGKELLIYFNAFSRDRAHPCPQGSRSIGVAKIRRDGFVGLMATSPDNPGTLTTRPVLICKPQLLANVELREGEGEVEFALLDGAGHEMPGFSFADSNAINSDSVRARVSWSDRLELQTVMNQEVRIAARISGSAVLYAIAFQ
jgi:hypothetical protein